MLRTDPLHCIASRGMQVVCSVVLRPELRREGPWQLWGCSPFPGAGEVQRVCGPWMGVGEGERDALPSRCCCRSKPRAGGQREVGAGSFF